MPSSTAIVYRVSYRREGWRDGVWKNKLFNSEGAATKYAGNLLAPITAETPEKFRELKPVTLKLSFGIVRWNALDAGDAVIEEQAGNYKDGWTTALRAVKALKQRIAPNDPEPTLEECIAFQAAMEDE